MLCVKFWILQMSLNTIVRFAVFCLQKTAEVRKSRKSGSDDDFGIEELISGEGGGFGMSLTVRNETFGFRRQLNTFKT
jgi:hypothetical protein